MVSSVLHDLRYALREIRRRPGASLVPLFTLAIGIGAATAVFSVVNGVLLRPLPYHEPERLINIWNDYGEGATGQSLPAVSANSWRYYQQHSTRFVDFGAAAGALELGATGIVGGAGSTPERIVLGGVSANFFTVLGVRPMVGRSFVPEDDLFGAPRTVMLSYPYWIRRFNGDQKVVGTTIEVDDIPRTIIGVLPPDFRLLHPSETYVLRDSDIWMPLQLDWNQQGRHNFTVYTVIGRLKPGVTLAEAQEELDRIARQLRAENPSIDAAGLRIRGIPLHQDVVKSVRPALLVLLAAVGVLVLIASANVANLLLARASTREREVAIRLALGASRLQLVRQLLIESAVLTLTAGVTGVAMAVGGLWLLRRVEPANLPRLADIGVDWRVLLFTGALLLLTALLSGLAPALHAARQALVNVLGGARVANHGRQPLLRNALIVCQVAMSVVLLVGAGLLIRSFMQLQAVRPGFVAEGTQSFHIALPRHRYGNFDARRAFTAQMLERLRALPGVTAVGATSSLPFTGQAPTMRYAFESNPDEFQTLRAERSSVTADYFTAAGTRLLAGRSFTDADRGGAAQVVIVDELIARKGWPNESAIGKRIQVGPLSDSAFAFATIVGVAEHVRANDLREDGLPQIYWSYNARSLTNMNYVLRTSLPPEQLSAAVRRVAAAVDPALPVSNFAPLTQYLSAALAQARMTLILMQLVGGLAVFLAAVGLYGVIAFIVAQRTREFGIRLALGESPRGLRRRVLTGGMRLIAVSAAAGIIAALLAVGAVQRLLYQVSPYDPVIYSAVALFLLVVGAVACYAPARRASRADPLVALRAE